MTIIDLTTHKLTRLYGAFGEDAMCLTSKAMLAIATTKPRFIEVSGVGLDAKSECGITDINRPIVRVKTRKGEFWADKKTGTLYRDDGSCLTSDTLRLEL